MCRVAVALVPTVETVEKAHKANYNLLVIHEPIFFQALDYPTWRDIFSDTVYEEKLALLKRHGIIAWQNHDHMHTHQPNSIFSGVIIRLGWHGFEISLAKNCRRCIVSSCRRLLPYGI